MPFARVDLPRHSAFDIATALLLSQGKQVGGDAIFLQTNLTVSLA
jgi:hypothetical protein